MAVLVVQALLLLCGRYAVLAILIFATGRLGVEILVGFPDTPALGPVPGNYYLRPETRTEAFGQSLRNVFIFGALGYLGWRIAYGPDVREYFKGKPPRASAADIRVAR